jgi:hypothetical protein
VDDQASQPAAKNVIQTLISGDQSNPIKAADLELAKNEVGLKQLSELIEENSVGLSDDQAMTLLRFDASLFRNFWIEEWIADLQNKAKLDPVSKQAELRKTWYRNSEAHDWSEYESRLISIAEETIKIRDKARNILGEIGILLNPSTPGHSSIIDLSVLYEFERRLDLIQDFQMILKKFSKKVGKRAYVAEKIIEIGKLSSKIRGAVGDEQKAALKVFRSAIPKKMLEEAICISTELIELSFLANEVITAGYNAKNDSDASKQSAQEAKAALHEAAKRFKLDKGDNQLQDNPSLWRSDPQSDMALLEVFRPEFGQCRLDWYERKPNQHALEFTGEIYGQDSQSMRRSLKRVEEKR